MNVYVGDDLTIAAMLALFKVQVDADIVPSSTVIINVGDSDVTVSYNDKPINITKFCGNSTCAPSQFYDKLKENIYRDMPIACDNPNARRSFWRSAFIIFLVFVVAAIIIAGIVYICTRKSSGRHRLVEERP